MKKMHNSRNRGALPFWFGPSATFCHDFSSAGLAGRERSVSLPNRILRRIFNAFFAEKGK